MAGGGKQGEGNALDDMLPLIAVLAIWFVGVVLWIVGHQYISAVYIYVRTLTFYPLTALGEATGFLTFSRDWVMQHCQPDSAYSIICHADFKKTQWKVLTDSSFYVHLVLCLPIIWMGFSAFVRSTIHPDNKYARKHDVDSFITEMRPVHPHLNLVEHLDLLPVPLTDADFRMSYTPFEYCFVHRLFKGFELSLDKGLNSEVIPVVDERKLAQKLAEELGQQWAGVPQGFKNASTAELFVLAIAMPVVAASDTVSPLNDKEFDDARDQSNELIKYLFEFFAIDDDGVEDRAWMKREPDRGVAIAVIKKWMNNRLVQELMASHAYTRTIIFRFLTQARRLGKMAAADMRWLRYYDKKTWYLVQSVGRPTPYVEAAATWYHALVEIKNAAPITEPQVDNAVKGILSRVADYRYSIREKEAYESGAALLDRSDVIDWDDAVEPDKK